MPLPRDIPAYVSLLESCCAARNLHKIQQLHSQAIKMGISHNDFIRAKLVSCYASCAQMADASYIFSLSNRQSTFLYNTLIRGYAFVKDYNRSLATFRLMLASHKPIDCNTLPTVLRSVSGLSLLRVGLRVHAFVLVNGLGFDVGHCNGLVTMYAKCGDLGSARTVFGRMPERNLVSWSAMMGGCASHGVFEEVFELFYRMVDSGILPDGTIFTTLLTACTRGGLVKEGKEYFEMMRRRFGIRPSMEHYTCMVDLLGRAGQLEEAKELIETMEMEPDDVLWRAFWGSCRIHGVVDITGVEEDDDHESYKRIHGIALSSTEESSVPVAVLLEHIKEQGWMMEISEDLWYLHLLEQPLSHS
ncbi:hypothetical protein Dimus_009322 [Dionaea muscipula]